jgi:hypothetical protein
MGIETPSVGSEGTEGPSSGDEVKIHSNRPSEVTVGEYRPSKGIEVDGISAGDKVAIARQRSLGGGEVIHPLLQGGEVVHRSLPGEVAELPLVDRLAGLRRELAQAIERAQEDPRQLRGAVEEIRGSFASLLSGDALRAIVSIPSVSVQAAAQAVRSNLQELESRLTEVLERTGHYPFPPPPTAREAVREALRGLDEVVEQAVTDSDLPIKVANALDELDRKLQWLLLEWNADSERATARARRLLPSILQVVAQVSVAVVMDQSSAQIIDGIRKSGIVDPLIAQSVVGVIQGGIGHRIIKAAKVAGDLIAKRGIGSDKVMIADRTDRYALTAIDSYVQLQDRLVSPSDPVTITDAQMVRANIALYFRNRDELLTQSQTRPTQNLASLSLELNKMRIVADDAAQTLEQRRQSDLTEFRHKIDDRDLHRMRQLAKNEMLRIRGK